MSLSSELEFIYACEWKLRKQFLSVVKQRCTWQTEQMLLVRFSFLISAQLAHLFLRDDFTILCSGTDGDVVADTRLDVWTHELSDLFRLEKFPIMPRATACRNCSGVRAGIDGCSSRNF